MKTVNHTRKDYMNGVCTHREYYGQFVTDYIKRLVLSSIGDKEFLTIKFSADENLNNIPLVKWDSLAANRELFALNENNDGKRYYSLSNGVCVLKEAARQIIESN